MSLSHNSFTFPNSTLKDFCEEYIKLSERIILWDKDYMESIDSAEKEVTTAFIIGTKTQFRNETEMKLHFMRLRVNNITQVINNNPGAQKCQRELTKFLSKHKYEVETLKLGYSAGEVLSPTQIYANYYCVVKKLDIIKAQIDSKNKK